jgi:hypothetical protein
MTEVLDRQTLSDAMNEEWTQWHARHKRVDALGRVDYPDLLGPHGRPSGWRAQAMMRYTSREGYPAVVCLTRRVGGGWMLVEQEEGYTRISRVVLFGTSLDGVHTSLCSLTDSGSINKYSLFETMVSGFIATYYDPTDPEEAAEQMLVGLGGRPHRLPAALPD